MLKRWHTDISNLFSGLRNNPDFPFNDNFYQEILDKKAEFEAMAPNDQEQVSNFDSVSLNNDILFDEVSKAIDKAKMRKAYLQIPNEALKNQVFSALLYIWP